MIFSRYKNKLSPNKSYDIISNLDTIDDKTKLLLHVITLLSKTMDDSVKSELQKIVDGSVSYVVAFGSLANSLREYDIFLTPPDYSNFTPCNIQATDSMKSSVWLLHHTVHTSSLEAMQNILPRLHLPSDLDINELYNVLKDPLASINETSYYREFLQTATILSDDVFKFIIKPGGQDTETLYNIDNLTSFIRNKVLSNPLPVTLPTLKLAKD